MTTMLRDPARPGSTPTRDARTFFRVRTRLAVRCRSLDAFDLESVRREIAAGREEGARSNARLFAWLERIERKLDRLLAAAGGAPAPETGGGGPQEIVLSGAGVRLETHERVALGDEVLVELAIPGAREEMVRALARVAAVEAKSALTGPRAVGLSFTAIDEGDREAIVRYTHDVQRTLSSDVDASNAAGRKGA